MIRKVNRWCNVKTGSDTTHAHRQVEVTVPSLRLNLTPSEARGLAASLVEAAAEGERLLGETSADR